MGRKVYVALAHPVYISELPMAMCLECGTGRMGKRTGILAMIPLPGARFSGIRYSHTRQEPSAPVRGFLLYLQRWYLSLPPGESAPGTLPTDTGPKP